MKRIFVDPVVLTFGVMSSAIVIAGTISIAITFLNMGDMGFRFTIVQWIINAFVAPLVTALSFICVAVVLARIFKLKIRRFSLDVELDADPDLRPANPVKFDDDDKAAQFKDQQDAIEQSRGR